MDNIINELGICGKNVKATQKDDTFIAVVPYSWLKKLMKCKKLEYDQKKIYDRVWQVDGNPVPPWTKIVIRVFPKRKSKVLPLPRSKLSTGKNDTPLSFSQLLSYVSQTNHRNLWKESFKKHCVNHNSQSTKEQTTVNVVDYDNILNEVVSRLYGCNIIKISVDPADPNCQTSEVVSGKHATKVYDTHSNILPVICAIDMDKCLYLIHHFHFSHTLQDCLFFSPVLLEVNYSRNLFIIYQLLQLMRSMYNRGVNFGEVKLEDIYVKENLWIQVSPQINCSLHTVDWEDISEYSKVRATDQQSTKGKGWVESRGRESLEREDLCTLEKLCHLWVKGRISNLDYLIHLNVLSGRRSGDPVAHHVVPWVTDFSSRCGKQWRDLTKSKYRLTKGDRQLDMTYDILGREYLGMHAGPHQIPHHVSDVLSDITYYVYMARRTSKEVLCRNVRNNWVPAEYPSSIQRMQEWTPDECIPEFFSDPNVFKSLHEDLPDLEVPAWATCVEDFITKHREALESVQVSESLHHWIDLTFGYKLSGSAAIKAKNVCLSLVDGHTELSRSGPVQLFSSPHPSRMSQLTQCWGEKLPPRIYWQKEKKKTRTNDSSEDFSDDEEEDSNLPQNYSSLKIPASQKPSSTRRKSSSSRSRKHSKKDDDSPQGTIPPSPSHSSISTVEGRTTSSLSVPRHFKVQKSEYGKPPIFLPKEFNPVSQLLAIENLHNFKVKTFYNHSDKSNQSETESRIQSKKISVNLEPATSNKEDLSSVYQSDLHCGDNSFTNQMFVASYEHSYYKRNSKTESKEPFVKEKKDRSFNTRFVTNVSLFKQLVISHRKKDMQVLGCLIVEIFLNQKVRPFQSRSVKCFNERYKVCCLVLKNNMNALPKCIKYVACLLLQLGEVDYSAQDMENQLEDYLELNADQINYPSIQNNGLPSPSATQLLQPLLSNQLLPFPQHFPMLYSVITVLHEYSITERELTILYSFDCNGQECSKYQYFDKTKLYFNQKIAEAKVYSCSLQIENFFNQISSFNQFDSVNLFLPHFIELLSNKTTSILASWYLFDPVSKVLGPIESSKKLLRLILVLYDDHSSEKNINSSKADLSYNMTAYNSKKSVKLYHNIFLLQLIVRFGLQCFLENFVPHLVEAVGGYKDTSITEVSMHTHSNIPVKPTTSIKKLTYCDESLKPSTSTPHDILSPDTSCGSENTLTPCIEKDYNLTVDKFKKTQCDSVAESDLFHFESDSNKEGRSDVFSSEKSWENNIFNKSNIKCLIEEIDCITDSTNLDKYLNHVQAIEATESIYGGDEDESSKSDDPQNKSDGIYFDENNYGSTSPGSQSGKDSSDAVMIKVGPASPTIAIPNSQRTFTSYVQPPEEDDSQEVFRTESKNASQSLDLNKPSTSQHHKSLRSRDHHKSKDKTTPPRSQLLYFATNNAKDYKISEMSSESLIWLAHRLGPVLTCKYLTRNLLKMLTLCYIGRENLLPNSEDANSNRLDSLCIANGRLVGDRNASKVIECLTTIGALYGEQIILIQYFPHMGDLIASCRRRISGPLEGGLIACLQLLRFLIPYMSDVKLMEQLQDIILKNILHPTVRLISSTRSTFPNGHLARLALAKKFLETLYVLALRIGPEMTKKHLCVPALQRFFLAFDKVHNNSDWKKSDDEPSNIPKAGPSQETDDSVYSVEEGGSYLEICRDGSTAEWQIRDGEVCGGQPTGDSSSSPPDKTDPATMSALEELQTVFNSELAHQSYMPFYKYVGEETMDRILKNPDTVRRLCREYDSIRRPDSPPCKLQHKSPPKPQPPVQISPSEEVYNKRALNESNPVKIGMDVHLGRSDSVPCRKNSTSEETSNSNSFGSNVAIIGNRIDVQSDLVEEGSTRSGFSYTDALDIVSCKMENGLRSSRHLRGDWLMYWEHEIGRPDKDNRFNLKQIKLQTFSGHTHSIKSIVCLDNENSFMSGSKDKTIKLWSLRNQGDGSATSTCQWTYTGHRKGVLSLTFLESSRLAASTDASVHIWDPYVESIVAQLDNSKSSPVSIVKAMPAPSTIVLAATTDTVLKLIDSRMCSFIHELKVTFNPNTFIRCICVSPSGRWVAVGLATGHLSLLDPRTGALLAHWKAHDGEILQLVTINEASIVSTSLDQTMLVWSTVDGKLRFQLKGSTEPVHCLSTYFTELISGTTNNRIGVHTAIDQDASFSSTKLRSDTFKGVLTSMTVLPLNRMLLLGGESGNISLLC